MITRFLHFIFDSFSLCLFLSPPFPGDILLRVNYAVSRQNKLVERYGSVYQIAAPAFTLTKKLFFTHHSRSSSRPGPMTRGAVYAQMQSPTQQQPAAALGHGQGHGARSDRDAPAAAVTAAPTALGIVPSVSTGPGVQRRSHSHSAPPSPRSARISFLPVQRRGSL